MVFNFQTRKLAEREYFCLPLHGSVIHGVRKTLQHDLVYALSITKCRHMVFTTFEIVLFSAESYRPQPCPLHGIYIVDNHDGCYHNMDLGCQNSSLVDVTPGCPSTKGRVLF